MGLRRVVISEGEGIHIYLYPRIKQIEQYKESVSQKGNLREGEAPKWVSP